MKNFIKFIASLGIFVSLFIWSLYRVEAGSWWWFNYNDPVQVLDNVVDNANKNPSDDVQNTKMDKVTSRLNSCWIAGKYTFSNTLCFITNNLYYYLQYVVYIGLAMATIFLVWNWFQLVTSADKQKQIWVFKKNLINIGVWVILIVAFYIIIDIFVSVVNLVAWD